MPKREHSSIPLRPISFSDDSRRKSLSGSDHGGAGQKTPSPSAEYLSSANGTVDATTASASDNIVGLSAVAAVEVPALKNLEVSNQDSSPATPIDADAKRRTEEQATVLRRRRQQEREARLRQQLDIAESEPLTAEPLSPTPVRTFILRWLPWVLSKTVPISIFFVIAAILLSLCRSMLFPSVQVPMLKPETSLQLGEPNEFAFSDLTGMKDLRTALSRHRVTPSMVKEFGTFSQHLSDAIKFKTVSYVDKSKVDWSQFLGLHKYLAKTYPLTFSKLKVETVANYSLLMTWNGRDKSVAPVLFAAHLDVVPVDPDSIAAWKVEPWSGHIKDGYVWGRGAMDDKVAVIALFDSIERLLQLGFQPRRTFMFAFGHDEEVSGVDGARNIGRILRKRGVKFDFIMDEGLTVVTQIFPNLSKPLALIGTSEKGFLVLKVSVNATGGHSSFPPKHTAIGYLSEAIAKLEANPFPSRFSGPGVGMLSSIAPEMESMFSPLRFAIANLWFFKHLLTSYLSSLREIGPFFKTTQAVTVFHAGTKFNVLPSSASAEVNYRLAPWDSIADVVKRVRETVNRERPAGFPEVHVEIADVGNVEASPVTDADGPAYRLLAGTIRHVFRQQNVVVAPGIMIANTDTRHYWTLSDSILRFNPLWLAKQDLARIHGVNERVSILELAKSVEFFTTLIRNADEWVKSDSKI